MLNLALVPDRPIHLRLVENQQRDLPLFEGEERLPTGHFRGRGVKTCKDEKRLGGMYRKVFDVMKDQHWRTVEEIQAITGGRDATIDRMLRYIGDPLFGGHHKDTRPRDRAKGLWEHRIIPKGTNAFNNWIKDQPKP